MVSPAVLHRMGYNLPKPYSTSSLSVFPYSLMDFHHNRSGLDIGHGMDGRDSGPRIKVSPNLLLEVKSQ